MSFSSYDSVKEQIREAIDIVELVSRYVPLRRQGANYVGRCPWHDDSRPSLQVNPQRQSYKCWVCNVGGDIFSFIMQVEKVDFREALDILAEKAGIRLPDKRDGVRLDGFLKKDRQNEKSGQNENVEDGHSGINDDPAYVSKKTLYQAMQWACDRYHHALLNLEEALPARKYLEDRGITRASIKQFQIGYAPLERDWWINQLKGDPKRIGILEVLGVLTRRQEEEEDRSRRSNQPYDRFRGRVLFPIRDTQDRTVAFGGRVLPNAPFASRAKYINSPETPLFSKHRLLYGLDIARLTMSKTRRALVMEGYTDCIIAHQYGFSDAVAVLGTALGAEHVRILKRFSDKIYLILDGDEAGRKRANEVLELFVAQGADMSVLTLPGGEDPAEYLESQGAEGFTLLLEHESLDALEHAFVAGTRGIDLNNDIVGGTAALDRLLAVIAKAPAMLGQIDEQRILRLEKTIQRLSQRFGIDEGQVRRRLKQIRSNEQSRTQSRTHTRSFEGDTFGAEPVVERGSVPDSRHGIDESVWNDPRQWPDGLERELIELWLADPTTHYAFWEHIDTDWFRSPITRAISRKSNEMFDREKLPTFENLLTSFDDVRMKNFLVDLDESGRAKRMVPPAPTVDAEGNTLEHEAIEQPYTEETKERLVKEIIASFDRRRDDHRHRLDIGKLKGDSLSKEEKIDTLANLLERQKKKHEKK